MKASLFLDTSFHQVIGLLDEQYQWIEFAHYTEKKGAIFLHQWIHQILDKHNLKLNQIKNFFQVAGPGSYTGMRLSEGIRQIMDWSQFPTYSFYHFEVPSLLGVSSGQWFSFAFKGEIFCCSWDQPMNFHFSLVKEAQSLADISSKNNALYTHFLEAFDFSGYSNIRETSKLIYENPSALFFKVEKMNIKHPPYYYRSIDAEFIKPK